MEKPQKPLSSVWLDKGDDFTRILALSDGIFAIALTLLAVDLFLPEIDPSRVHAELPGAILNLLPEFAAFALTFYLVMVKWMAHRRIFQHITRYDSTLLWLNNWFLLFVAFMPVPASVLGRFPKEPLALIFFGISQMIMTGLQWALWWYMTRGHQFSDETIDDEAIQFFNNRYLVDMLGLGAFTLLALVNVWLAYAALLFVGVIFQFIIRTARNRRGAARGE